MLEKKKMSKDNWKRVLSKEYKYNVLNDMAISVIFLKELTGPCFKEYYGRKVKIADNGYYWLQLAFRDQNWWLTAMYDKDLNLIQYYFDITDGNIINGNSEAEFYDLYLDVVIMHDGDKYLLDEDELKIALKNGEITNNQYKIAYTTAKKIINMTNEQIKELDLFCYKKLNNVLKEGVF